MGENEQGGMLRTVIVLGLIAIIAGAVIFMVTQSSAKVKSTPRDVTTQLSKTIEEQNEQTDKAETSYFTFDYDETNKTAATTGLNFGGYKGNLPLGKTVMEAVFPSKVIKDGVTYTVTAIKGNGNYNGASFTSIVIPNSVKTIDDYAFQGQSTYKSVKFGVNSQLTVIGKSTFGYSSSLESIIIPASVKIISDDAFHTDPLKSITFATGSQLESIGKEAFGDGNSANVIDSLVIPDSVKTIGEAAFRNVNVKSLTLDENLETIGNMAFMGNSNLGGYLTKLNIPANVETIGYNAFNYQEHLIELTFAKNSKLKSIGGVAFNVSPIKTLELPESLETVGDAAFNRSQITELILPDSVQQVGSGAFGTGTLTQGSVKAKAGFTGYEESSFLGRDADGNLIPITPVNK